MTYYNNKKELMGGSIVLYTRNLHTANQSAKTHRRNNWYMKFKLQSSGKWVNKSTRCCDFGEATSFATQEFYRLQRAAHLGKTTQCWTFEKHWKDWHQRMVQSGSWQHERADWHQKYFNRYFKEYFSTKDGKSMSLEDIDSKYARGYWDWRIAYWQTGNGTKLAAYNPKRRGNAKTLGSKNGKKAPADKTLAMEQSVLNQIFFDAIGDKRMSTGFKMKAPSNGKPVSRRPHFEEAEYKALYQYLRSYRDCVGVFAAPNLSFELPLVS